MSSTTLIIRDYKGYTGKGGKALIFIRYCHRQKQTLLSTGESIPAEYWDKKRQEVKKSYRGFTSMNSYLQSVTEKIDNLAHEAKFRNIDPTVDYIKEKFAQMNNPEAPGLDLIPFIEEFIIESRSSKRPGTIKGYVTTLNHLKAFEIKRKVKLNYDSINMAFYANFKKYLMTELELGRNVFGKYVKVLKTLLNAALERKLHNNQEYKSKGFKALDEVADTIYLTEVELQRIFDLDLSNNPRLEKVRSLFYVGCFTGLRWSDFTQIKPQNIQNGFINIMTQKTSQKVIVPLHPNVLQIMKRYDNVLPMQISNQKFNVYLKEIGLLAGIDETITVTKMKASGKEEKTYKKYERITSHCARRSFATNLFLQGFPSLNIMKITGHKTERAFLKYIKVTEEQAAVLLKEHWVKSNSYLKVA